MSEINKASQQSLQRILDKIGVKSSNEKKEEINKSTLGQEDFLKLMTTQLQNQDPLKPKDGTEMASQLAQFNGLEQMMNVNKSLERLEKSTNKAQDFNLINTVGKDALLKTNQIVVKDGIPSDLDFTLPTKTTTAKVVINNANGKIVAEENLGALNAGSQTFEWDKMKNTDRKFPDGVYSAAVSYTDNEGATQNLETFAKTKIKGVKFSEGESITLETKLGDKLLSEVQAVRNSEQEATTTKDPDKKTRIEQTSPMTTSQKATIQAKKEELTNTQKQAPEAIATQPKNPQQSTKSS